MAEPQPPRRHRRRGKLLIQLGAVVCVLLALGLALLLLRPRKKEPAPPPPPVAYMTAYSAPAPILLHGIGQVQAYNTFQVHSRVDGAITAIGYSEGGPVKAGGLLVQIDPRPYQAALQQAQATRARDQAQLDNARIDLNRYAQLLPGGLTTKQTYDTQAATVRQLEGTIASDDAQIRQARLNVDYASIRAPFAGRTGQRLVDIGNVVHSTDQNSLAVLTQTKPIFVNFTLPEQDIGPVREAMRQGKVVIEAYDGDDQKLLARGDLVLIDNAVDQASGTVHLKALYANGDEALWPGEFVNARVFLRVVHTAVTVPSAAVQMGPNGRYVFVIGPDGAAQIKPVQVGQIEADRAMIDNGVQPGDKIVVDGAYGLMAGTKVNARIAAPNDTSTAATENTGRTPSGGPGASPAQNEAPQKQSGRPGQELNGPESPGARTPPGNPSEDKRAGPPPPPPSTKSRGKGAAGGGA